MTEKIRLIGQDPGRSKSTRRGISSRKRLFDSPDEADGLIDDLLVERSEERPVKQVADRRERDMQPLERIGGSRRHGDDQLRTAVERPLGFLGAVDEQHRGHADAAMRKVRSVYLVLGSRSRSIWMTRKPAARAINASDAALNMCQ